LCTSCLAPASCESFRTGAKTSGRQGRGRRVPVNHLRILVRVRWVTDRWSGLASDAYLCSPRSRSTSDTTNTLLFFRFFVFSVNKMIKTTDPESLLGSGSQECFSSVRKWHQAAAAMTLVQPSTIISAASIRLTFVGVGRFSLPLLSRSLSSKRSSSSSFAKEEWRWWGRPRRSSSEPFAKHWVGSRYTSSPF